MQIFLVILSYVAALLLIPFIVVFSAYSEHKRNKKNERLKAKFFNKK